MDNRTIATLEEVNAAARIIVKTLKEANVEPAAIATAMSSLYRQAGFDVPQMSADGTVNYVVRYR